ncbi:MAG: hypothetical protein KAX10_10050, partial [Candidatus Lokiarchaeota archaeon]|nr:hypothetical protein [Candidatus Lokiarchaeota archaeon]
MENITQKELRKIQKLEKRQGILTGYVSKIGKLLLYILPLVLVVITILTIFQISQDAILYAIFYIVLVIYGINSLILFYGASLTKKSFQSRLKFERKRGRPIDSLDGFDLLSSKVQRVINLLKIIALVGIVSLVLFIIMLAFNTVELGYAAIGFTMVGLGLALIIRSLNLKVSEVNGLQDFYKPTTHQIFLDNFFAEIFSNHLDPVTFLKWDDYMLGLQKILNPNFVQKIKTQEPDEMPITFAIEKILFLFYLKYQNVLSDELFAQEMREVLNIDDEIFNIERGLLMENNWYFSKKDIYKIFLFIKKYNPGFFNIIDRLQLELADNIERLAKDPIYMDSSSQEIVYVNDELNIMIYLFNNAPENRKYSVRIIAPGFDPKELVLDIEVEGRGTFRIPEKPIPLTAMGDTVDICGVLSVMLENGDTTWITLEPREVGEQT